DQITCGVISAGHSTFFSVDTTSDGAGVISLEGMFRNGNANFNTRAGVLIGNYALTQSRVGYGLEIWSGHGNALTRTSTMFTNHRLSGTSRDWLNVVTQNDTTTVANWNVQTFSLPVGSTFTGGAITCSSVNGQATNTWFRLRKFVNVFTGDGTSTARTLAIPAGNIVVSILCTGNGTVISPTITGVFTATISFTQTWTNGVSYVLTAMAHQDGAT
ncbi:MAG: hypothetical protein Q8J97_08105, partial [Flavobacteriaceae bacterium]|nr:hypothetical protein [Flavobacteriaceae bacterium]